MRIALASNSAWSIINFRRNLIDRLKSEGHSVYIICNNEEKYNKIFKEMGVEVINARILPSGTNPVLELFALIRLIYIFKLIKFDFVFSFTPKINIYMGIVTRILNLSFIPNVSGLGRVFIKISPLTLFVKFLYYISFRDAQAIFFQNSDDLEEFVKLRLVTPERCCLLPGSGVDLDHFNFRRIENRGSGNLTFLMVARLLWDKGIGEYVEAARLIKNIYPNTRFLVLGPHGVDNPSAVDFATLSQWTNSGAIDYVGMVSDVRPYLEMADCVVLPSYREGMPRSLLEASAIGRPIIAAASPGCRDAVVDGQTGFLCKVRDVGSLYQAMIDCISLSYEERLQMGAKGRIRAEALFSESVVINKYLSHLLLAK
jgi:glycosyltransferase involved in cell wall biosynthesis